MKSITPEHITSVILSRTVDRIPNTTVTIVTLHLKNGATAVGIDKGTVNREDHDWHLGLVNATNDARAKVHELESYLLHEKLWQQQRDKEIMSILINEHPCATTKSQEEFIVKNYVPPMIINPTQL